MMKYWMLITLFWFFCIVVPVAIMAAGDDSGKPPVAPKGCTWVYVPIEEAPDGTVIMLPFLACKEIKA